MRRQPYVCNYSKSMPLSTVPIHRQLQRSKRSNDQLYQLLEQVRNGNISNHGGQTIVMQRRSLVKTRLFNSWSAVTNNSGKTSRVMLGALWPISRKIMYWLPSNASLCVKKTAWWHGSSSTTCVRTVMKQYAVSAHGSVGKQASANSPSNAQAVTLQ